MRSPTPGHVDMVTYSQGVSSFDYERFHLGRGSAARRGTLWHNLSCDVDYDHWYALPQ